MANPVRLNRQQIEQLWVNQGGDPKYAGVMANLALRESGGNPYAHNTKAPDNSYGLWQINVYPGANTDFAGQAKTGKLFTPQGNARAAIKILQRQGLHAWSTYNPAVDQKYIGKGAGGPLPAPSAPRSSGTRTVTTTTPGTDNSSARRDLIAQFVMQGGPDNQNALLGLASALPGLKDTPARKVTKTIPGSTVAPSSPAAPGADTSATGTTTFDGKPVAAWIAPALKYARQKGWSGTVASGYRSDAEQTRIYKSGVRPAALPQSMGGHGSNHEFTAFPGGAVDVTNASQLSQILQRSPYANKLVWAGAKDPVHFSKPHNGGY